MSGSAITRRIALIGLLVAFFFLSSGAVSYAQNNSTPLQALTVSLLPQYDDPRLMIVLEATLVQPGRGAVAIPPNVELIVAEALRPDNTYTEIEAAFDGAADGRFITFNSPTTAVRIILYQDSIPRQPERTLPFTLPAQRDDLTALNWRVVFPLGATSVATTPAMTPLGVAHYGMEAFEREAGALPARTTAEQEISWVRESDLPSFAHIITGSPATELASLPAPMENIPPSLVDNSDLPEAVTPTTRETGWVATFRNNPMLWGAVALFVVGLLLVLDGIRKSRNRPPEIEQ